MIHGLDTSVLVRLLTGRPRDLALAALTFVLESRRAGDRLRVSELVVAEAYYALQHHYGIAKKETLGALRQFLDTPGVEAEAGLSSVLATPRLESANPGFIDRVIHGGYRRSGVEQFVTFEKAATKLPGTLVLSA